MNQPISIDQKVSAVLTAYHERLDAELPELMQHTLDEPEATWDPFLLAVGPQTGQLLNIFIKSLSKPKILEVGTSYGYSTIWLAEAARATGGHVTTLELHGYKAAHAREMAAKAGLENYIDFKIGDALQTIAELPARFDFVLIDLWKDLYEPCAHVIYPKLNPGAIVVADNMVRPGGDYVQDYTKALLSKPGMTSVLLPVGSGIEISRYRPN